MFRETLFRGMDVPSFCSSPEGSLTARLDAIDRKILKELQDDGRMTNVELSRRVGISAPPCLRRVGGLEKAGDFRGSGGWPERRSPGSRWRCSPWCIWRARRSP